MFLDLTDKKWVALLQLGSNKEYYPGEFILRKCERCDGLICIKEGIVKSSSFLATGMEIIYAFDKAPTIIGISPLYNNNVSELFSIAITKVQVIVIPQDKMKEFMKENPDMMEIIMSFLAKRVHQLYARNENAYSSVPKRLTRFLLNSYQYGARITYEENNLKIFLKHNDIAGLIGTYRPRVTKYLNELENLGLIEKSRSYIYVKDFEGLTDYYNSID